ncbi:MAG TPA: aminopeptidase [Chloroflexota bacterium]|jgi:leucyl aminopeptidase (aminopeptidase T)|nr:aminopeptidase [Chloroflexota bacterium]
MAGSTIMSTMEDYAFDPELLEGARNAITTCLAVEPAETVTLITDTHTYHIAASLVAAIRERGAPYHTFVLEELADRPLHDRFPRQALEAIARSDVAISCFQPQEGEIGSRRQLIELIESRHIRYAHMVWISHEIMCQAMRADYRAVDALSDRVLAHMRTATKVTVKSPNGTHVEVQCDPALHWIKTSGLIDPQYWSNLPGGEVWTTPGTIDGVFVVNGSVGDYLCPKYGDIQATPLTLEIEGSRLRHARCANKDLLDDFLEYCRQAENGDRVGEFAIGTNIGITQMIGNLLQDEKVPGVHIAFGNPYGSQTGATWNCPTHIDAITRHCDVWAGSTQIMADGAFLV